MRRRACAWVHWKKGLCGLVLAASGCATPAIARAQSDAALREARSALAEGDARAAAALLEGEGVLSPHGYYLLGLARQQQLQHTAAAEAFAQADTASARVLAALGRSLEALGRTHEAEQRYLAAYRQDSLDVSLALNLARLWGDAGRWEEVAALYRPLVLADSSNALLHARLAAAYARADSADGAIVHYEIAQRLDVANPQTTLGLSKVYLDAGQLISARRAVERALDALPEQAALWQRRGDVAMAEEHYDVAGEAFVQALTYGDSTALVLRNLGASLYWEGQNEDAAAALQAAYARDTTDVMGAFYLGMAYQGLGNYDASLRYLERAAVLNGQATLSDIHLQIGLTQGQRSRYGDAIGAYRLAQMLRPDRADVLFYLAAVYESYYADPSAAVKHYEDFLAATAGDAASPLRPIAQQRIQALREEAFFEQGRGSLRDTTAEQEP